MLFKYSVDIRTSSNTTNKELPFRGKLNTGKIERTYEELTEIAKKNCFNKPTLHTYHRY